MAFKVLDLSDMKAGWKIIDTSDLPKFLSSQSTQPNITSTSAKPSNKTQYTNPTTTTAPFSSFTNKYDPAVVEVDCTFITGCC